MSNLTEKKAFATLVFQQGKKQGVSEMEISIREREGLNIKAFDGEVDGYTTFMESVLSLRGIYKGKVGSAYTEKLEEEAIFTLIEDLIESAKNNDAREIEKILEGQGQYQKAIAYNPELKNLDQKKKLEFVLEAEKQALSLGRKITGVNYNGYEEETVNNFIINTKGLELEETNNSATAYLSVVAEEQGDIKTGTAIFTSNSFESFDAKNLARMAAEDADGLLGARTIESKEYPVILRNNVAAIMLDSFAPIFQGDRIEKNLSMYKGRLKERVASSCVSLLENPLMENGARSRSFDDDGTPTFAKHIISKGMLENYLHNNKTATKAGVESTGNGIRVTHKNQVGVAATNMYIENQEKSFDELLSLMGNGILIIDVQGTHAGMDPISGDFSLQSSGYMIENGKIAEPIHQIIIAGNYYSVLEHVQAVADDLAFNAPYISYIGSPSLLVNGITVAGE